MIIFENIESFLQFYKIWVSKQLKQSQPRHQLLYKGKLYMKIKTQRHLSKISVQINHIKRILDFGHIYKSLPYHF